MCIVYIYVRCAVVSVLIENVLCYDEIPSVIGRCCDDVSGLRERSSYSFTLGMLVSDDLTLAYISPIVQRNITCISSNLYLITFEHMLSLAQKPLPFFTPPTCRLPQGFGMLPRDVVMASQFSLLA